MKKARHCLRCALALYSFFFSMPGAFAAPSGPSLEGGPCIPWRFADLRLESPGGILGKVEVWGGFWDGPDLLLYREEVGAWTSSLPIRVYIDESLSWLEARAEGPTGPIRARLELDAADPGLASLPGEAVRRARMRSLVPAWTRAGDGYLPAAIDLGASSPDKAAREVLGSLPLGPPPLASLGILGLFALGATIAAGLPGRKGHRPLAAIVIASLAAAALCLALLPRQPRLVVVELPPPDGRGLVSGRLAASQARPRSQAVTHYASELGASGLSFFVLSTPGKGGIELEALALPGDDLVFSRPPLVAGEDGSFFLSSDLPVTGWRLHGSR